jgi:rhamnose utilization protein RhaD (predicted bifunctional aldolase and dehydrogenase)/NAD(P)-dependent dehydrogenase (short-subunit alcohol dehydrogenase family)
MQSRWNDADAARCPTPLELRVYTSRLLGQEPSLVLHGGGNTSVKTTVPNLFGDPEDVVYIKGSGWDLATITPAGFSPVRFDVLRRMADLRELSDTAMVQAQRAAMTDPEAPTPSVEAILHAIIPAVYVDHTHADAVVTISNTPDGEARIRALFGDSVLVVPYVMPGFVLARAVRELTRSTDWSRIRGIVLLHHGVFTFADDARTSYERMLELVTTAERYLELEGAAAQAPSNDGTFADADLESLARLRCTVGRAGGGAVVAWPQLTSPLRAFAMRPDLEDIVTRGPLTPDHVIRTKPVPLVGDGEWEAAIAAYAGRYRDYFARYARPGLTCLDPAPRWVVWRGRGVVTFGASSKEAGIVADIARHTLGAIEHAERMGGWRALPEPQLFEVEYWELEQAKLRRAGRQPPLAGRVALVTGAAGGIGRACAETLLEHGAMVVATDINPAVGPLFTREGCIGIVANATDRAAVERSIAECVRRYGGLDILVSNAGGFSPSQRLDAMDQHTWEHSLALNLSSHMTLVRAAAPFLRLGFEPSIVFIGSKNVSAPGPGAGAYSVAKAGLAQLARVAALELAPDGIRVNTVHPHLVLDTAAWTPAVLAERASHYGMTVEEYRRNNLLGVEITTRDVANAVVALVGPLFAKTTGAQIPIDGGNDRVV